jgi:hypothetical protein
MAKALIIRTSGLREIVEFEVGNSYDTLKTAVGGWLECVHLPSIGADLWLNEEGKLIGLPYSPYGTVLWAKEYGFTDKIMGDIVITGGADEEGETLGLTEEQLKAVLIEIEEIPFVK